MTVLPDRLPSRLAVFLLAAAPCVPSPLVAQDARALPADTLTLVGRVVDMESGAPIPGAVIEIPGRDALRIADDSGFFAFPGMRPGRLPLAIQALGYASKFDSVTVRAGQAALVRLGARPIVLPDVSVAVRTDSYVARLNYWVKATGFQYAIFGPEELRNSVNESIQSLLQSRTSAFFVLCPGDGTEVFPAPCMDYHARRGGLRVLFNDLAIAPGTMLYQSPRDFYLMQFIPRLRLLRIYTQEYIEALVRRGWSPQPIMTWPTGG
jgi:hypothetical protein